MTRIFGIGLGLCLPLFAIACVEMDKPMAAIEVTDVQPVTATYACGAEGSITVQSLSGAVLVTSPEGEQVELPASPAAQKTRFGQEGYALVLEGQEALYMKAGRTPLTCRR